jgi:Secretion system C-terminal sorting domain
MKKNQSIFFLFIACTTWILFSSNSGGVFSADHTGNSGMPGGGASCGSAYCHGGMTAVDASRMNVRVLDGSGQAITNYTPAATYTVEVLVKVNAATKAGFQSVVCLFAGAGGAGTATNTVMPTATQQTVINSTNYISHTSAGTTSAISAGYAKWQYKWVAPATNVGAITVATAANISNNNGQPSGDSAIQTVTILQAPNSITDINFSKTFDVFPMPAQSFICVKNNEIVNSKISIINMNGAIVKTILDYNFAQAKQINISDLANGFYTMMITDNHKTAIKYFSKN